MLCATYHLKPLLHWCSALKVLGGSLNVEVDLLLGKINHVGGEQWLSVLLEVLLISVEKAVQPWKELLGAVISMEDDWNTVCWRNSADVLSTCDTTSDGSLLVAILHALMSISLYASTLTMLSNLSGEVCCTSLGHLEDDWRLGIASSLKRCNDSRR